MYPRTSATRDEPEEVNDFPDPNKPTPPSTGVHQTVQSPGGSVTPMPHPLENAGKAGAGASGAAAAGSPTNSGAAGGGDSVSKRRGSAASTHERDAAIANLMAARERTHGSHSPRTRSPERGGGNDSDQVHFGQSPNDQTQKLQRMFTSLKPSLLRGASNSSPVGVAGIGAPVVSGGAGAAGGGAAAPTGSESARLSADASSANKSKSGAGGAPLQPTNAWGAASSGAGSGSGSGGKSSGSVDPQSPTVVTITSPTNSSKKMKPKSQTPRSSAVINKRNQQSFYYKHDDSDSDGSGAMGDQDAGSDDDDAAGRRERRRGTWQPDAAAGQGQMFMQPALHAAAAHVHGSAPTTPQQLPSSSAASVMMNATASFSPQPPLQTVPPPRERLSHERQSISGSLNPHGLRDASAHLGGVAGAGQTATSGPYAGIAVGLLHPNYHGSKHGSIIAKPDLKSGGLNLLSPPADGKAPAQNRASAAGGKAKSPYHVLDRLTSIPYRDHREAGHEHEEEDLLEDDMTEDEFAQTASKLAPADMLGTMRQMFNSLKQMRKMLKEINSMPVDVDKNETFARIVSRIRSIINAEHVLLFLAEGDYLVCTASTQPIGEGTIQRGNGFAGWVAKHRSSLNLKSEADSDPRALFEPLIQTGVRFKSLLCVPIMNKNRQIVAVIEVVNKRAAGSVPPPGGKNKRGGKSAAASPSPVASSAGTSSGGGAGPSGGGSAAAPAGAGGASGSIAAATAAAKARKIYFTEQDQQIVEFMSTIAGHSIENSLLYDEAITRRTQTETLLQVAELLAAEVDTDMVIQRVVEASYLLVNAERITLFMVDEKNDELVQKVARSNKKEAIRIPLTKGIVGYVATTGKPVNAENAHEDWRFDAEIDKMRGFEVRSILTVPVCDHLGKTVAVIEAINKIGGYGFTRDEEALLQSMAVSAGIVLRKSQLYEEAVTRRKQTEALLQITELMSAELGVNKVIQKIVMAAYMLVHADRIQLYMVDEMTHELVCEVTKGAVGFRLPLGAGVPGHVALTGRVVNIADAQRDWRFDSVMDEKTRYETKSVLAVPVKDFLGKTVAVIEVMNKKGPAKQITEFSSDDETVLKSLAVTAGTVLRKATLFDEAITRRKQTEALLQITELMSAEIGSEKVMQRIIEASYTLVNAERITLFSVDPITKELVCKVSKDEKFVGVRMPYGHGIVGHVALTRRSLNIADAYRDPRFDPASDIKTGYKTKSILTVPVTDRKGGAVAVIQAVNKKQPDGDQKTLASGQNSIFTAEDVTILESMAVSAGIILHKSRLYDAAVFADRKSRALMQLVKAAAREGTIEVIINSIAKVAYDALNADRVTIYFVDPVKEEVWCIVCKDEPGWSLPMGKGIAGYVAKTGQKVNLRNAYEDVRFDPSWDHKTNYQTKTVLCVPVKDMQGQVIAVIQALNKKKQRLDLDNPSNQYWKEADVIREEKDFIIQSAKSKQFSVAAGASPKIVNEEIIEPFSEEDEEILDAFCVEVRAVVRRHQTDAIIEHSNSTGKKSDVAVSLIEMYNTQTRSKLLGGQHAQQFVWPIINIESSKISKVNHLDFNVWSHSPDDLLVLTFEILQEMRLIDDFAMEPTKVKNFLYAVRSKYQANPFHNWYHGFSVFHFSYLTLRMTNCASLLSTLDVLALLISSLCHDIDHPGNTNAYEVNVDSKLALLHNDISVLENHHSVTTFEILRAPQSNIFEKMVREKYMALRKTIVAAILATDMSVHFESCKNLDTRELDTPFNSKIESERQNIVKVLIHSSDLSGQVFPTIIAQVWEEKISREFELQALSEKSKNLPVLSHMQNLHDPIIRAQNQVAFIDYVLTPWWRSVCRVFPGLKPCFDNLVNNRKHYDMTAKALTALKGPTGVSPAAAAATGDAKAAPAASPTPTAAAATTTPPTAASGAATATVVTPVVSTATVVTTAASPKPPAPTAAAPSTPKTAAPAAKQ